MLFVDTVDTVYEDQSMQCFELLFMALTQHHIQSTVRCENSTLLCMKWPLAPPRVKAI